MSSPTASSLPIRSSPSPDTLFILKPLNAGADAMLTHPPNHHLVTRFTTSEGESCIGLGVGLYIRSGAQWTIATIGRLGDIKTDHEDVSRFQCSFEIHDDTYEILLYDIKGTTQVFGDDDDDVTPIDVWGNRRQVVLDPNTQPTLGFGGRLRDACLFEIHWHHSAQTIKRMLRECGKGHRVQHPAQASTAYSTPIARIDQRPPHNIIGLLGTGRFGPVYRALNLTTGAHIAVKVVRVPNSQSPASVSVQTEIQMLKRVVHPHIVEYLAHFISSDDPRKLEIFTEAAHGNLQDLIDENIILSRPGVHITLLKQMLDALDYLAGHNIVHLDVKPDNILQLAPKSTENEYKFQLADFGSACFTGTLVATSDIPTQFTAPELEEASTREVRATTKTDIWSLYFTVAYAFNADGFRDKTSRGNEYWANAVQEAARCPDLSLIQSMASTDPAQRPTPRHLLRALFNMESPGSPMDLDSPVFPRTLASLADTFGASTGSASQPCEDSGEARLSHVPPTPTIRQPPKRRRTGDSDPNLSPE